MPAVSCWLLNLSKQKATEWAVIFHDVTGTRCQTTRLRLWHTVTTTVGKTAQTILGSTVILRTFRPFLNNTAQIIKCACTILIHFQWPCKSRHKRIPHSPPHGPQEPSASQQKTFFLLPQRHKQAKNVLQCLWCILFAMFSPTCFGGYCGHLQGDIIITRIQMMLTCVTILHNNKNYNLS